MSDARAAATSVAGFVQTLRMPEAMTIWRVAARHSSAIAKNSGPSPAGIQIVP